MGSPIVQMSKASYHGWLNKPDPARNSVPKRTLSSHYRTSAIYGYTPNWGLAVTNKIVIVDTKNNYLRALDIAAI